MTQFVRLGEIATLVHAKLQGDSNCLINTVAPINHAASGQITFIENEKYINALKSTQASAVLLTNQFVEFCTTNALVVQNPKLALSKIYHFLCPHKTKTSGIHPTAVVGVNCDISSSALISAQVVIGDNVSIAENVSIGPGTSIGSNVKIGANTVTYPNVSIYHDVIIGADVIIHSGAVLGADGYGFEQDNDGSWIKFTQMGSVIIGDQVEVGANTTIDRGTLENTVIAKGVKLDNLIMVAHNVCIGENTVIAACTGIAGSAKIGKNCMIAGASAINGHITLVDNVIVSGMSMVTKSLMQPGVYSSGTGILPRREWQKSAIRFKQLDKIYQRLKILEKHNDD